MQHVLEISTQVAAGLAYLHATPAFGSADTHQPHSAISMELGRVGDTTLRLSASQESSVLVGTQSDKTQRIVHRGELLLHGRHL
jgi:hypothetical protein